MSPVTQSEIVGAIKDQTTTLLRLDASYEKMDQSLKDIQEIFKKFISASGISSNNQAQPSVTSQEGIQGSKIEKFSSNMNFQTPATSVNLMGLEKLSIKDIEQKKEFSVHKVTKPNSLHIYNHFSISSNEGSFESLDSPRYIMEKCAPKVIDEMPKRVANEILNLLVGDDKEFNIESSYCLKIQTQYQEKLDEIKMDEVHVNDDNFNMIHEIELKFVTRNNEADGCEGIKKMGQLDSGLIVIDNFEWKPGVIDQLVQELVKKSKDLFSWIQFYTILSLCELYDVKEVFTSLRDDYGSKRKALRYSWHKWKAKLLLFILIENGCLWYGNIVYRLKNLLTSMNYFGSDVKPFVYSASGNPIVFVSVARKPAKNRNMRWSFATIFDKEIGNGSKMKEATEKGYGNTFRDDKVVHFVTSCELGITRDATVYVTGWLKHADCGLAYVGESNALQAYFAALKSFTTVWSNKKLWWIFGVTGGYWFYKTTDMKLLIQFRTLQFLKLLLYYCFISGNVVIKVAAYASFVGRGTKKVEFLKLIRRVHVVVLSKRGVVKSINLWNCGTQILVTVHGPNWRSYKGNNSNDRWLNYHLHDSYLELVCFCTNFLVSLIRDIRKQQSFLIISFSANAIFLTSEELTRMNIWNFGGHERRISYCQLQIDEWMHTCAKVLWVSSLEFLRSRILYGGSNDMCQINSRGGHL